MAGGTYVDVHFFGGGADLHRIAAGTTDLRLTIFGVDIFFHN